MVPLDPDTLAALVGCVAFSIAIFGGLELSSRHTKALDRPHVRIDDPEDDWILLWEAEDKACRRS